VNRRHLPQTPGGKIFAVGERLLIFRSVKDYKVF